MPQRSSTSSRRRPWLVASPLLAVVIAGAVVALVLTSREGSGADGRVAASESAVEKRLFAEGSFWNARVPGEADLEVSSGARVERLAGEIERKMDEGLQPAIAADSYSTPVYVVPPDQQRVPVALPDAGDWGDPLREALDEGVPIPADARPAEGTDGHMTVYQPSTDTLWEFWRARKEGDEWQASWGGAMREVSSNPGYYSDSVWSGLQPSEGWNWGSTATSLPVAGGLITMAELREGVIPHALAISVPDACADLVVKPARRGDGNDEDPDCMPEGARLRLDPDVDVASLGLSPLTEKVARAAQDYGLVVRDVTRGGNASLYAEAPQGASPYGRQDGPFDGLKPWQTLEKFPWDRLQMLEAEPCGEAPCADD